MMEFIPMVKDFILPSQKQCSHWRVGYLLVAKFLAYIIFILCAYYFILKIQLSKFKLYFSAMPLAETGMQKCRILIPAQQQDQKCI